jgi:elongation factor G
MTLAVDAPESASGSVVSDLTSRRGNLSQIENLGLACRIRAEVPLSNLFGYINTLRSQTGGKGTFSQRFSHYAEVPFPPGDPDDFRPAVGMRG